MLVEDDGLGMQSADELRAELQRGLTREASDFNPFKVLAPAQMTVIREALVLPGLFLTVALLGGLRSASAVRLVPPPSSRSCSAC